MKGGLGYCIFVEASNGEKECEIEKEAPNPKDLFVAKERGLLVSFWNAEEDAFNLPVLNLTSFFLSILVFFSQRISALILRVERSTQIPFPITKFA